MTTFAVGDKVVWHDPEDPLCVEEGFITEILADGEAIHFPDTIICLAMKYGDEKECFAEELWKPNPAFF